MGKEHAEPQFGGEGVVVQVDAVGGGGSLEAIGDTHGEDSLLILNVEGEAVCIVVLRVAQIIVPAKGCACGMKLRVNRDFSDHVSSCL